MKIFMNTNIKDIKNLILFNSFYVLNEHQDVQLVFDRNDNAEFSVEIIEVSGSEKRFVFSFEGKEKLYESLQEGFDDFICNFFDSKMTKAYGFTVKDQYGQKYKPSVSIFLKNAGWYKLPKNIKYIKTTAAIENSEDIEILIDSEELKTILETNEMLFVNENSLFKLF